MNNSVRELEESVSLDNSTLNLTGDSIFTNNSAIQGGGIDALNSNLTLTGSKTFRSNSAEYGGGVGALKSTVTFIGKSTFEIKLSSQMWWRCHCTLQHSEVHWKHKRH